MPGRFPPGATASQSRPVASRWREFLFAFHQLTQAIQPVLSLRYLIENWTHIAAQLAEPPRIRKAQEQKFYPHKPKQVSVYGAPPYAFLSRGLAAKNPTHFRAAKSDKPHPDHDK